MMPDTEEILLGCQSSCPSSVMAGIASYSHQFVLEVLLCWASPEWCEEGLPAMQTIELPFNQVLTYVSQHSKGLTYFLQLNFHKNVTKETLAFTLCLELIINHPSPVATCFWQISGVSSTYSPLCYLSLTILSCFSSHKHILPARAALPLMSHSG